MFLAPYPLVILHNCVLLTLVAMPEDSGGKNASRELQNTKFPPIEYNNVKGLVACVEAEITSFRCTWEWVFLSLLDNESMILDKTKYKIAQNDDVHILVVLILSKYFDV
jgi:hypothetical protein